MTLQANDPVTATAIRATTEALLITVNGASAAVPWERCSPRLALATERERAHAELSPGGYGIHWPLLDEDLSVGGLVRAVS
jgi:hypothetical protein